MTPLRLAVGFALTMVLSSCNLPTGPLVPVNGETRPDPATSADPLFPPPVQSAAGCDLYLFGVVTQSASAGTPAADATVTWRHANGGPFETDEIRADINGRYNVCVPLPSSADCGSGACSVKYEIRAMKSGYAADSTSVIASYNYWDFNYFRVPDLQLVSE